MTKSPLYLRLEHAAGDCSMKDMAVDLVELSKRLGLMVVVKVNYRADMIANEGDDAATVLSRWKLRDKSFRRFRPSENP
jgi:hypothetical protein